MSYVSVQVIRNPGDKQADDIIDPLCTTEAVAVERGRVFIDEHYKHKVNVSGDGPFTTWMAPGSLLDVVNTNAPSYKGMCTAMPLSMVRSDDTIELDSNIVLERLNDE